MAVLSCAGEETRIVGGAVRNSLLGLPVNDIDMATTALPEETLRRAKAAGLRAIPTGIEHGTITVIAEGRPVEVTTLRRDLETDGRHAIVAFGRDFRKDALRRDFTVNALMLDAQRQLHDEVGGLADLAEGRIRFIGEARQRITEDALRILRFYRFHAAYGHGAPDAEGRAACIAGRAGLERLSAERIRAEMLKLVVAKGAAPALTAMADDGLLLAVLGGVAQVARFEQVVQADDDIYRDPVARLAMLSVSIREDALKLRE
ncbi:MAG: CCA tRNA nucleotidyltransferase, partial [Bosea sp. (in: a-proteobacteria)]